MKSKNDVKKLVFVALMTALSVLIGFICKTYFTFGAVRITLENLPIILTGFILGPLYGGAAGMAADLVTAPSTGSVNPIITLGAALIGVIAGLMGKYLLKGKSLFGIFLSVITAHAVGSMLVKSFGLWYVYGYAIQLCLLRIPTYFVISMAETYIIYILYKNKGISSMAERMLRK